VNALFVPVSLQLFVATFARSAAFLHSAPIVGDRQVPRKIRVVAALLLAVAVAPVRADIQVDDLAYVVPGEVMIGLIAGFVGRLMMGGIAAGAEIMGMQLGLGFAAQYDPNLGEVALAARRVAMVVASVAFIGFGGIEAAVTVATGPVIDGPSILERIQVLFVQSATVLPVAVRFAAPALIAATVANLAMGLMSRAAPALNVFSVMLSLVLVMGIAVMIATAPGTLRDISTMARLAVDYIHRVVAP